MAFKNKDVLSSFCSIVSALYCHLLISKNVPVHCMPVSRKRKKVNKNNVPYKVSLEKKLHKYFIDCTVNNIYV